MRIFISWSGDTARPVAEALRTWFPTVLAGRVECFVSSQDIRRGERGMDVIAGELQDRDYGVVVLTRDNMNSAWVNFEAGALGKSLGVGKVAPLLLDITRADVEGPMAQFQSTLLTDRNDMRQFVRDLAVLTPGVPEASIDALFDAKWEELDTAVVQAGAGVKNPKTTRSTESMLEEVLDHVRALGKAHPTVLTPDQDEALRQSRLSHLDKLHGGKVFHIGKDYIDVQDFSPSTDEVLIPVGKPPVATWVRVADGAITPF